MIPSRIIGPSSRFCAAVLFIVAAHSGCGWIADKERIIVAEIDGKPVRRGDIMGIIRAMSDEERPLIQTKGDLLLTLRRYIDDQIRIIVADEIMSSKELEVSREEASERYFKKHPEFRQVYRIKDPAALDLTPGEMAALVAEVEFGIDDEEKILLRELAMIEKVKEILPTGVLKISDAELEAEYKLRKREFKKYEHVEFLAIRFPAAIPNAVGEAAAARRRIDSGESFEEVAAWYRNQNRSFVQRSAFDNDPTAEKFRTFWTVVSGCSVGDVIGPVYLPVHDILVRTPDGRTQPLEMPDAHLVLEVIDYRPESSLTIAEAKPALVPDILTRKVMAILREQHGVRIFEEKLPDPAGYGNQFKKIMIDTSAVLGADQE